jgi:hypothetical protein
MVFAGGRQALPVARESDVVDDVGVAGEFRQTRARLR